MTDAEKAARQAESSLRWSASVARVEVDESIQPAMCPWRVACYDEKDEYIGGSLAWTYLDARQKRLGYIRAAKRARKVLEERDK